MYCIYGRDYILHNLILDYGNINATLVLHFKEKVKYVTVS
jgi:hypothetical protein